MTQSALPTIAIYQLLRHEILNYVSFHYMFLAYLVRMLIKWRKTGFQKLKRFNSNSKTQFARQAIKNEN